MSTDLSAYAGPEGGRVYYEVSGAGRDTVVLIHGWSCDSTFWRLQRAELAKEFRVIVLDLPGFGKSDRPEATYDIRFFARGVEAVLAAAGVTRATLVGHSLAVPVIRQVFEDRPDLAVALVLVDGTVWRRHPERERALTGLAHEFRGPGRRQALTRFLDSMFTAATPAELREWILDRMLSADQQIAADAMEQLARHSMADAGPATVPVLAVNRKSSRGEVRLLHEELLPALQYEEMENAGHFLMLEKPNEFNALLIAFLKTVSG